MISFRFVAVAGLSVASLYYGTRFLFSAYHHRRSSEFRNISEDAVQSEKYISGSDEEEKDSLYDHLIYPRRPSVEDLTLKGESTHAPTKDCAQTPVTDSLQSQTEYATMLAAVGS